ncbi:MAG: diguanylate cyclase [Pseudohongiella sp.]|nr:diguanylate cyclase [Pseudohongiella sp.]
MPDSKQHDARCQRNPAVERRRNVLPVAGDHADAAHGAIERERMEHALEESEQRYRGLVELSRDAVLLHSEGALVFVSEKAAVLFGAGSPEQLLGKPFLDFVHPDDRDTVARRIGTLAAPGRSVPFFRHKLFRIDGTALHAEVAANACGYRDKPAVQLLVRDVAERSRLESRLSDLAQYDALTELPNRGQLRDRLEGAMARATRNKQLVGVMFLDLDHFRALNATLGQAAGDLVLKQMAERLRHGMRKGDTVVRLSGDAFAVILEGLAEKEGALVAARRELESLSRPLLLDGQEVRLTASIGITVFPLDAQDLDTLLRNADAAMHYAKKRGRNNCQPYSPELDAHGQRDELRRAGIEQRLASLTPREREVLDLLVSGKANKMIAYLLDASPRTIEQHRAKVMAKMQADSLPGLVRMVLDLRG